MATALILAPTWPTTFRRIVRDPTGKPLRTLSFEKGNPVLIDGDDLKAVQCDIGRAIVPAALDSQGKPQSKVAPQQQQRRKGR